MTHRSMADSKHPPSRRRSSSARLVCLSVTRSIGGRGDAASARASSACARTVASGRALVQALGQLGSSPPGDALDAGRQAPTAPWRMLVNPGRRLFQKPPARGSPGAFRQACRWWAGWFVVIGQWQMCHCRSVRDWRRLQRFSTVK